MVGVDETLERRQGKKIAAKGIYRDPVRSSHSQVVKTSALRWVCLALLTPDPMGLSGLGLALPFSARSFRTLREKSGESGIRSLPSGRGSAPFQVRRWYPNVRSWPSPTADTLL